MAHAIRPLWEVLLIITNARSDAVLACAECFAILEYLAEIGAAGGDPGVLQHLANQYLQHCPDCRTYYRQRMYELEALQDAHSPSRQPGRASMCGK